MITLEREQHTNDGGTTWTAEVTIRGRRFKFEWYGPTHWYHPETPDYLRRSWKGDR
jgi:hypothetical protein